MRHTPHVGTLTRTSPAAGDRGSRVTARSGRRSMGPGESTIQARIRPAWGRGHRPDQGRLTVDGGTADLCAWRRRARRGPPRNGRTPASIIRRPTEAIDSLDAAVIRSTDMPDRTCSRSRSPPAATAKTSRSEIMPDRAAHQERARAQPPMTGSARARRIRYDSTSCHLFPPRQTSFVQTGASASVRSQVSRSRTGRSSSVA